LKLNEALPAKRTPAGSNEQQLQAYIALRSASRLVAASLISGKKEFRAGIKRMQDNADSRNKKDDGKIYDALDVQDLEQKQVLWVMSTTKQLRALNDLEVSMLGIVSSRGLVPDEEGLEALEYVAE
jgi:hypothetical protein